MFLLFFVNNFLINTFDLSGNIPTEERGEEGFGYDPVFYIPSLGKTFSQLSDDEKNAISHRGAALAALRNKLHEIQENK